MARRGDVVAPLQHIREAIDHLQAFAAGKGLDDYLREPMLRFAVERGVEIISEASRRIPDDLKARHGHIPWREIAGIGNVLRHDYERVDDRELWTVVTRDLPPLKAVVEAMLREAGAGEGG